MKVALVVPGGVDRSATRNVIPCLLWLIERLAAGGDEVHVFALRQEPLPGRWPLLGAEVHNAGRRPRRLRTLAQIMTEHRRSRFDVVHSFWAAGPGVVAAAFARLTGVPLVLTLPGGDLSAIFDIGYGGRLTARGRAWTRLAIAGAHRIVVPTRWMGDRAEQLGIDTLRIPWGVALDVWPVRTPRPRGAGEPLRLLHVASLNRVKDQATLLQAMKILADQNLDFRLDIVGLDCLDGAVQRYCSDLALVDRVTFHGFLPHAATRSFFEQADLLVMSSRHEAVPMVSLEAAVAGVPTVGTAVGQIADWNGAASVAVPVGDHAALAAAILRLSKDDDARLRLAREAQAATVAEDADVTAVRTRALYAELTGG